MKKEEFVALGISEELAKKAADASEKELKTYVPKHQFDEVNEENKNLKNSVEANQKAMEELQKAAGNNEELAGQIQKLQDEAKENELKHQNEMKELKLTNAIKLALSGSAQDEELVAGLFDKSKLILGDDGKVTGLEEQLKGLKENRPYLFKTEEKPAGFRRIGVPKTEQTQSGIEGKTQLSMKDAIAAKLASQTQSE